MYVFLQVDCTSARRVRTAADSPAAEDDTIRSVCKIFFRFERYFFNFNISESWFGQQKNFCQIFFYFFKIVQQCNKTVFFYQTMTTVDSGSQQEPVDE